MKFICFIFLFFLSVSLSFGQSSSVEGTIRLADNTPVTRATIRVEGTDISVVSDTNGHFKINNVPLGKQQIIVTSLQIYKKSVLIDVKQTESHLEIVVDINDVQHIDEVTVVGSSTKREIETKGFAVNVIQTEQAALRNIQTNELLDRTVGVRVRQSGGIGSEVQYNLNGMTGRSVGVFIDGIEISTYGSSFNLNNIPPSMVDRIEVYKGVLPAHLTRDLLGGAINIVLKKANLTNSLNAAISYGSFGTMQADLSGIYRNAKTGFTTKITGAYLSSDNDYEIWGKFSKYIEPNGVVRRNFRTKRFFDAYQSLTGRFEFGYTDVKWADSFLLGLNISDTYKEIQHGQTMGTPYMGRVSEANAKVLSLNYNKKDLGIQGLNFAVNAVYSFRNTYIQDTIPWSYNWDGNIRQDINGNPVKRPDGAQQGKPSMTNIDRNILNMRSNLSYELLQGHRLSLNHVFYAVDRQDQNLLTTVGKNSLNSKNDFSKNVISFNYEAQLFHDRLTSNLFYKLYQQSISNTNYTGKVENGQVSVTENYIADNRFNSGYGLALSFKLKPNIVLLSSVERAVRMPVDLETFGSPEDNVLANPGISPEVSDNYNLGMRLGTFDYDNHKISISGNAFWRNTKDRIMPKANELISSQEIELTQYVNLGLTQSLGFEGEFMYTYKDLAFNFNFSKFNSLFKQRIDPTNGKQMAYYNQQIPNEPFFTMNSNIHYRFTDLIQKNSALSLFYTLGYVAPFRTVWPESDWFITPTQISQNMGLSYTFPSRRLTASLDVKNVFNAELFDNFGVQKPGRGFYLKLNYSIHKF